MFTYDFRYKTKDVQEGFRGPVQSRHGFFKRNEETLNDDELEEILDDKIEKGQPQEEWVVIILGDGRARVVARFDKRY